MRTKSPVLRKPTFLLAFGFELTLGLVALLAGFALKISPGDARWEVRGVTVGLVAILPPLGLLWWTLESRLALLVNHRRTLNRLLPHVFEGWAIWQLALISAAAGISEELLFRGLIQTGLGQLLGLGSGLILASVLFGLAHFLTPVYAFLAGVIGLYLGLIFVWSGNLVVPMVTHGVYDFVALVYLLKLRRGTDGSDWPMQDGGT